MKEYTLEGEGDEKILLLSIKGTISSAERKGFWGERPSMLQELVSQLRLAQDDPDIRAVVLKVDSPGGTVTASDIIYNELMLFRDKRAKEGEEVKIVACFMTLAASGAYYVSLPADKIFAHPTSIVGSVGAIISLPKLHRLMDKLGLEIEVTKSGSNKDMGSLFRESSKEEERAIKSMIDAMAERFLELTKKHRKLEVAQIAEVAKAGVYLAPTAKELGLVDEIGYLPDAIAAAKQLAAIPKDARVVTYRRGEFSDDNIYNSMIDTAMPTPSLGLVSDITPLLEGLRDYLSYRATEGFLYLWEPGLTTVDTPAY